MNEMILLLTKKPSGPRFMAMITHENMLKSALEIMN